MAFNYKAMPFEKRTVMEQKIDFIMLNMQKDISFSDLCKRFNISRPTGYKWLLRYKSEGLNGIYERSRRPNTFPLQTSIKVEELIVRLRKEEPEWGPKKLHRLLLKMRGQGTYPHDTIPVPSTIGSILKRRGLIDDKKSQAATPWKRFEYDQPNELWQMDFKGEFLMRNNNYCYPFTVTDDHSRYNIILQACDNQQFTTVQYYLTKAFRKYGMPAMILCDNGPPWGMAGHNINKEQKRITKLEKWMIQLNIQLIHGRPYHPQTQGKQERFHKTLQQELLNYKSMKDIEHCQNEFNKWRLKYNHVRPHEAINQHVPSERYKVSNRAFPDRIPENKFMENDIVRKVDQCGRITLNNKKYKVGKALSGDLLAVRPIDQNKTFEVIYFNNRIRKIYL